MDLKLSPVAIAQPKGRTVGTVPAEEGWSEAPSGFGPYADFKKPGEFIEGTYLSVIPNTGPNQRAFYRLNVDGKTIGVWGNQSLDQSMAAVKPDSYVKIVYLGGEATKRNQNPVKVYLVRVKR